jgi:hypothetical protein
MQHIWGRQEMHTKFQLESLRGRDCSEDRDMDWWIALVGVDWILLA